jgi:tetratricopeptide (TPR) repeat protein
MTIQSLVASLHKALVSRKIEQGKRLLSKHASILKRMAPLHPSAPRALYVLSGWAGYSEQAVAIARKLDGAYRPKAPSSFSHEAVCEIMAGKASLALYEGKFEEIQEAWQWMQHHQRHFQASPELSATMNFVMSRGAKKEAQYDLALNLIPLVIQQYEQAQLPGMVAVARATEGWLLVQRGDNARAAQSWEAAYPVLKNSEDWTVLGNIRLFEARRYGRDAEYAKALLAFEEAAELYAKCVPHHRSLRRVLLETANMELRLAYREPDAARARELSDSAGKHIERAEALLKPDPGDIRNSLRLLISLTNKYMCGVHRLLYLARGHARRAYDLAKKHRDGLMQARACYKQAVIEFRAADDDMLNCEDPVHRRLLACGFASEGLELASHFNSDRLEARLHTLLGNLFLAFPFRDPDYAQSNWEAAVERMARHQDRDYVMQEIEALGRKLNLPSNLVPAKPIFIVTDKAVHQRMASTLAEAERAIVMTAIKLLGKKATRNSVSDLLKVGHGRIEKYFDEFEKLSASVPAIAPVPVQVAHNNDIFRVKAALAFSQPLDKTLERVKSAVKMSAFIYNKGNTRAAIKALHMNWTSFNA